MKQIILATLLAGIAATGAMAQPVPGPLVQGIHGVHKSIQDFVRHSTDDLINKPLIGGGDHDYVTHGLLGEDGHGIWKPTQPGEVVIFDES